MRVIPQSPAIYEIRNVDNGKVYIGSAVRARARWIRHQSDLNRGIHHSPKLQAAWRRYGAQRFEFNILEEVHDKAELTSREQAWIDRLDPVARGYNVAPIAGNCLGVKHGPEMRRKVSERQIGKKRSAETCKRMSDGMRGQNTAPLSAEHRAKISAALIGNQYSRGKSPSQETRLKIGAATKGIPRSDEAKARISAALKGRKRTPEHIANHAAAVRGKVLSAEARSNISEGLLRAHEKRRQQLAAGAKEPSCE